MYVIRVNAPAASYDSDHPVYTHHESTEKGLKDTMLPRRNITFETNTESEAVAEQLVRVFESVFGEGTTVIDWKDAK